MKSTVRYLLSAAVAFSALCACTTTPEVKPEPVVVAPPPPPKPKELTADELFAQAVKAFDENKLDESEALFTKVLQKAPDNVSAIYDLGVIAERRGDIARAQAQYEAAHQADATHAPTLLNLGKVYRLQAKFDKAISLYEEALKAPGREFDVQLLNNLAVAYRLNKQFDKAELTVRKLLSRTRDNPDAYKNLSLIHFDQGNYRLAEFITGTARKLDEKDPGVYNNMGMIYLKQDQKPQALSQFQKAVSLDPNFVPGHMNIGAMALTFRDYENAEKSFKKALAVDANQPDAHLYLGWALEGQKNRDPKKGLEAGGQFEKYLAYRADASDAVCGAGWAYSVDKAGWEKAVSFLEKCRTTTTDSTQQQLIDAKVKGLTAMIKNGQKAAEPPPEKREAPKANAGGASVLDQAVKAAEQQDAAAPPPTEGEAPAAPAPAPAEGAQPQGAAPASGGAQPAEAPAAPAPAPAQ